jgi:acetyl esterase/lipase
MKTLSCIAITLIVLVPGCGQPRLMTPADLDRLAASPAGERHNYGQDDLQFGELVVPSGPGPHPVVINIHGGCWLAAYDLSPSRALAHALADDGIAVWNLEYRRVGDAGGGWPGTFLDVAAGADHLRHLAAGNNLDLKSVAVMGHSAGGHLALWLAGRRRIESQSPIHTEDPIRVRGVIAVAPAPQLVELHARKVCGHVVDKLMGGSPQDRPQRYRNGNPANLAPLGVPQTVIIGKYDEHWAWAGTEYVDQATLAGDTDINLIEAPRSGHFELIDPQSSTWHIVRRAVLTMLR